MPKKIFGFVILISLCIGCSNAGSSGKSTFSVVDALGRQVDFIGQPERMVIAGKQTPMLANFAYVFSAEGKNIAAIENRSQSPDRFLTSIDPNLEKKLVLEKGAGVEQISPLEPDLVILKTVMKDEIGSGLEEAGIKVVYLSFENVEEIKRDIRILGDVFAKSEKADGIIEFYDKSKATIDGLVEQADKKDVLLVQIDQKDGGFVYSVPAASWLQTKMVQDLQSNPVWVPDTASGGWMDVNIEQIIKWNPENIFVINYQGKAGEIIEKLEGDPVWQAFINQNDISIKPFPYDTISWDQPDPRWILGYASLAHMIYPENVSQDLILDLIQAFYAEFYNLDASYIREQIVPNILTQMQ